MTLDTLSPILARADAAEPSAGGGPVEQLIFATVVAGILFGGITWLALGYRRGKSQWLTKAGDFASARTGLPGWAAFPLGVLAFSLVLAVLGLYWDIGIHIQNGRDKGPLSSAAHYPIMFGLFGALSAGILAMVMPKPETKPSPWAVRVAEGWYAPVGGILLVVSTAFGLIGFPLDDYWHRLFGQDVTLWGPTHMLMLTGAGLCLIGASTLLTEGTWAARRAKIESDKPSGPRIENKLRRVAAAGGLLIALSIYQGEFDYGIAQFQMVLHPLMLMVAAGVALTFARMTAGKGGAIMAALFFIAVRGGLTLFVHFGIGMPVAHFPIYIGAAIAVELVGMMMAGKIVSKPIQFGLASGLAVGTIGLAGAWLWSQVWIPYPWTSALLPEGVIVGLLAALAGGAIGAWLGNGLMLRAKPTGALRFAPIVGFFVIVALAGYGLHQTSPKGLTATLVNTPADTGKPGKWVNTTVKLNTTQFDGDAQKWAVALAWQGKGFYFRKLEQVGPGEYKTAKPMPVYGSWKSIVRFHSGNTLMGTAIFQPKDSGIPAAETPALPQVTRALQADRVILQREYKFDGGSLQIVGYGVLLLISMLLLGTMAWGVQRVSNPLTEEQRSGRGLDEPTFGNGKPRTSPRSTATPRMT